MCRTSRAHVTQGGTRERRRAPPRIPSPPNMARLTATQRGWSSLNPNIECVLLAVSRASERKQWEARRQQCNGGGRDSPPGRGLQEGESSEGRQLVGKWAAEGVVAQVPANVVTRDKVQVLRRQGLLGRTQVERPGARQENMQTAMHTLIAHADSHAHIEAGTKLSTEWRF